MLEGGCSSSNTGAAKYIVRTVANGWWGFGNQLPSAEAFHAMHDAFEYLATGRLHDACGLRDSSTVGWEHMCANAHCPIPNTESPGEHPNHKHVEHVNTSHPLHRI
jgi:hypothetical protein